MLSVKLALPVAFYLALIINATLADTNAIQNGGIPTADVELLIVCDKAFSDRFDQDRQKIIDYWAVSMQDVNMRFKTLSTVDISFRVTSLIAINDEHDQPFITQARGMKGGYESDWMYENFGKWVYKNRQNLTNFDIAILVTAVEMPHGKKQDIGVFKTETACLDDDKKKMSRSIATFHSSSFWGNDCASLESGLATLLGAPSDGENDCGTGCGSELFLMATTPCDKNQFKFSKCSDTAMSNFVKSSKGECLRRTEVPDLDVLKDSLVTHPPTLTEQCIMTTINFSLVAKETENQCTRLTCHAEHGSFEAPRTLLPVDNSPCGNGKVCFRGRCKPQGHLLKNVGSEKCLYSKDRLSDQDAPVMDECLESPSPLDHITVVGEGSSERYLSIPFLSKEKCLSCGTTLDTEYVPKFAACPVHRDELKKLFGLESAENDLDDDYDEETVAWDLIQTGQGEGFLLYNRRTMACARVGEDNSVVLTESCARDDLRSRWKFVKKPVISLGWFNNYYHDAGYC